MLLSANEVPVTNFRDLDLEFVNEELNLVGVFSFLFGGSYYADFPCPLKRILRDGKEMEMVVPTAPISGLGTERIVSWAGVLLQEPHRSAAQQRKTMPEGIYSSWWSNGSPAHMYGLRATVWVTEVDGKPVKSLDRFVFVIFSPGKFVG